DQGNVKAFGKPMKEVRKKIAYVPQRSQIDWDFPITVRDTVLLGTFPRLGLFRRPKKADRQRAEQCLAEVDMKEFSKRQIGELSGGQQQRVLLASALAQRARRCLLYETFGGL